MFPIPSRQIVEKSSQPSQDREGFDPTVNFLLQLKNEQLKHDGQNKAEESSFRQAVYTACDIYKNRVFSAEINENPLKPAKGK